jgi:dGTPase
MKTIREGFEDRERNFISPYGCCSCNSRGRVKPEPLCPIRTVFQVDRDRIVYSNAFRRLKHKTQVFLAPLGQQYRTRLTHTLEVAQIARNIARALRLNEDLAEAIALGHDLGHTPFGHGGEIALKEVFSGSFSHQTHSLRVVDKLERDGRGLNLTFEVRDGILKHSKGYGDIISENPEENACTVEGRVVRIADIMAYLNHDLDDACRSGVIDEKQVPKSCSRILGPTHADRATSMIRDLVFSSYVDNGEFCLQMSDEVFAAMTDLRRFLYDNVYRSPKVHNEFVKARKVLIELYLYFLDHPQRLETESAKVGLVSPRNDDRSLERKTCDFIASMTDSHAMELYGKLFFPLPLDRERADAEIESGLYANNPN